MKRKLFQIMDEYGKLLKEIKEHIKVAQLKTVVAANSQMLWLYWQIGNFILENINNAGYGARIIEKLAADIKKEFPELSGFSIRNLKYMRQFAASYPDRLLEKLIEIKGNLKFSIKIVQQAVALLESIDNQLNSIGQQPVAQLEILFTQSILAKISWSHHIILLDKVPSMGERFWYMFNTIEHGSSRNVLVHQIESKLFERQIKADKITNFQRTLPEPQTDFAQYMLKDPYIFDFIQAKDKADERNIEKQLTEHITKFLLELGQGFAFIGRQVHFEIGGQDFYIDLLFYHTRLHAYVVVELKAKDFEPGDAGQLNFYINLVNDKLKSSTDNDTIGILLCKGKNAVLAEYALKNINQPIGVADYQLSKAIPDNLKSELPNIDDLEKELQ